MAEGKEPSSGVLALAGRSGMERGECKGSWWTERRLASKCGLYDMEKFGGNTVGLRRKSSFGRGGWGQDDWPEQ